mmetsp:Transcript_16612/g.43036  ORF Transcript_16612/g.43036 Transcript_16612/m.43036 type:complete len:330 (+) Transcript_16612:272-1261(+)
MLRRSTIWGCSTTRVQRASPRIRPWQWCGGARRLLRVCNGLNSALAELMPLVTAWSKTRQRVRCGSSRQRSRGTWRASTRSVCATWKARASQRTCGEACAGSPRPPTRIMWMLSTHLEPSSCTRSRMSCAITKWARAGSRAPPRQGISLPPLHTQSASQPAAASSGTRRRRAHGTKPVRCMRSPRSVSPSAPSLMPMASSWARCRTATGRAALSGCSYPTSQKRALSARWRVRQKMAMRTRQPTSPAWRAIARPQPSFVLAAGRGRAPGVRGAAWPSSAPRTASGRCGRCTRRTASNGRKKRRPLGRRHPATKQSSRADYARRHWSNST